MDLPDISLIAITLLGVTIPVFIFAVTLLGNAIERAKQEEKTAKEKQQQDLELKINDLDNKIKVLRESGDSSQLEIQLKEINKLRKGQKKHLSQIKGKYSALDFKHSIMIPGGFFLLSVILSELSKTTYLASWLNIVLWLGSVVAIASGLFKLSRSLILAQEISSSSEEFQLRRMTDSFKAAMVAYQKETEEKLKITFKDMSFPHNCGPSSELHISFRVNLFQGKVAHNVEIWFFVPDGFELIAPSEKKSWRQNEDFVVPNIRTVKTEIGTVRGGANSPSSIKLKTPDVAGNYFILYRIISDEYNSDRAKLEVVVKS